MSSASRSCRSPRPPPMARLPDRGEWKPRGTAMAPLHFEGDKDFPQPPAQVAAKLSDARFLAECIPGVEAVAKSEREEVVCTLRPGFAFVRGTLEVTLRVAEVVAGNSTRLLLHSKGIGSPSDVEAVLAFAPQGTGTRV